MRIQKLQKTYGLALVLVLALSLSILTACGAPQKPVVANTAENSTKAAATTVNATSASESTKAAATTANATSAANTTKADAVATTAGKGQGQGQGQGQSGTNTPKNESQNKASSGGHSNHNINYDAPPLTDAEKQTSPEGYGAKGAILDKNLTVTDMLIYAVQDEYLARAEYVAIEEKFGAQKPYSNIRSAEESHLSLLKELFLFYGLDFPADTSASHLVVPKDLLEAAKTGVQAEIDNIAMYELFLKYPLPENVSMVFNALKNGSENHLAAFQKQVTRLSK